MATGHLQDSRLITSLGRNGERDLLSTAELIRKPYDWYPNQASWKRLFPGNKMKHVSTVPVVIVDYDPTWPAIYAKEKAMILRAVGNRAVAIEHIGSTAVPGLGAKPIIDIMVAVRRLTDVEAIVEPLQAIGYEYRPDVTTTDRIFFNKGPPEAHRHLHITEEGSDSWWEHLLFRDFLRKHPDVARQYCELKRKLAAKFRSDREAYTEAKTTFINSVVGKARTEVRPCTSSDQA
jgi:GrpB-like predicted nucleotidyltransferase (UPF0157 family)